MAVLLDGRINRLTFMIGSGIGLAIMILIITIFIVPVALIDIVVNGSHVSVAFKPLYYIVFLVPGFIYFIYFCILAIKRAHDCGYPGVPILLVFTIAEVIGRLADLWILNFVSLLLLGLLFIIPGQKTRNNFGARPPTRFRMSSLRLNT